MNMDYLSVIKKPITDELNHFIELFNTSLEHQDGLLSQVLMFIKQRSGKRMRPMLMLLVAKAFGRVSEVTQHAAIGLELLHTASLVHDDVVDESGERRGQASVNAFYDNKVAVLVGDYILRDDIFDYYESNDIGKPTGNDMAEGKLTLPVIHAVLATDNGTMKDLALKVKKGEVTPEEVAQLIAFTKENGGIEYAEAKMREFKNKAIGFIEEKIQDTDIKQALNAYLDYVIERKL